MFDFKKRTKSEFAKSPEVINKPPITSERQKLLSSVASSSRENSSSQGQETELLLTREIAYREIKINKKSAI